MLSLPLQKIDSMKNILFILYGIVIFSFSGCKDQNKNTKVPLAVSKIEGKQLSIEKSLTEDEEIKTFVAPYRNRIKDEMNKVLSYVPNTLSKFDGEYNTAIGNMMADALLEITNPVFHQRTGKNIDAVLLNHGGIRSSINRGDITTKTAYNIMPFENEAVVIELKGTQVLKMFEYLSKSEVAHPVAGMQLTLTEDNQIKTGRIQGKSRSQQILFYRHQRLPDGWRRPYELFAIRESETYLDYKLRNVFIDYFKKHDTINPVRDERFIKQ